MPRQTIFDMAFSKVYPLLIAKAEKKGRTREEVFEITSWLTGYSDGEITAALESDITCGAFFANAPAWSPRADLITGKVCGVQVDATTDPLMKRVRQLDKLVDELAKGRPMEKVKR